VERVSPWVAAGIAACTLAATLAWNTWSAGGADSYGYVGQAHLLASGRLSSFEPLAAAAPWPEAAWTFTPLGFKPARRPGSSVPFYPPGLSIVMALALRLGGERAVYLVVPLLAALAVWMTFLLGRRLRDGPTGVVAALLLAVSPIFLYQAVQPMSDVAVVAWATAAMALACRPALAAAGLAGAAAGLAILTRPNLAPFFVPAALLFLRNRGGQPQVAPAVVRVRDDRTPRGAGERLLASPDRQEHDRAAERPPGDGGDQARHRASALWVPGQLAFDSRRLVAFVLGAAPGVLLLAFLQWAYYGSPLASGYGRLEAIFSFRNVVPNLVRYPRWLVESQTPVLALSLVAPVLLWRGRHHPGGRGRWRLGLVLLSSSAIVFATYLFFTPFDDWAFLRYLLPALPGLVVLASALVVAAFDRVPVPARWAGLALFCGLMVWFSMGEAANRQVFQLKAFERKYLDAGTWVASRLPRDAVVLTWQQSGSLRLYADRLTVRWDLLDPDWLDRALAFLDAHGRRPYLLVERPEEPVFRARFAGRSRYGDLDWRPLAQLGVVRIYDPRDRR
jgi:hypothetical protein